MALHVTAPKDEPWEAIAPPPRACPYRQRLDAEWRLWSELHRMARTFHGGVAFPQFNTDVGGPGSLGLFLGAGARIDDRTVWYDPCISDPDAHPPLRFDPANWWWRKHMEVIDRALAAAGGRYLVGFPDLIENLDTLAQLRGSQEVLMDLLERPEWVRDRIRQINQAWHHCFEALWPLLGEPFGGNAFYAFRIWGPGRTAKLQCDFQCMISPAMFRRFVRPALEEQCGWLDFSLFHLDGTEALPHLEGLLEIETLKAIEWTPQAGRPGGGSSEWHALYRRIRAAGKSVQAIEVRPEEVEPLIDAVGPDGLFIMTEAATEEEARSLLRRTGWPGEA